MLFPGDCSDDAVTRGPSNQSHAKAFTGLQLLDLGFTG